MKFEFLAQYTTAIVCWKQDLFSRERDSADNGVYTQGAASLSEKILLSKLYREKKIEIVGGELFIKFVL